MSDIHLEAVAQQREQCIHPLRAGAERTADTQLSQRGIAEFDLEMAVSHQLVGDITERLVLEMQAPLTAATACVV
jgi:hypothetical protein